MFQGVFENTGEKGVETRTIKDTFPKWCASGDRHLQCYDLTSPAENHQPARVRRLLRKQGQKKNN